MSWKRPASRPIAAVPAAALLLGLGLLAGVGLPAPARAAPAVPCGTTHWVGAWAADPSGALGAGYSDQTLRIILTPHIGGTALRVHLSNRFGAAPVRFAGASIALRRAGAALVPGSSVALTFGGHPGIIVPRGGEAISDAARLSFPAFADLVVSVYLADRSGPATGHLIARERSYATAAGSGDQTGQAAASAFVTAMTTVPYLDAVDVLAPASVGAIVLFGDSITDGYETAGAAGGEDQSAVDANQRYPDYLARRLLALPGGPQPSVVNAGISGNRLLADGTAALAGPSGPDRLGPDAIDVSGVTEVIVLEGINDINGVASAQQVEDGLAQIVARLHAANVRVLLGTITPAGTGLLNLGSLTYIESPANVVRVAVNAWIRGGASGADGVVDYDAALRGAAQPNVLDPAFDSGDHVHPNSLGYRRMADAVDLSQRGVSVCAASAAPRATKLRVRARVAAGRLRMSGSLTAAAAIDCTGADVTVRALHAGRTILKRRPRLTAACGFAATQRVSARGRIEVRVSFGGSPTLRPARARSVFARAA